MNGANSDRNTLRGVRPSGSLMALGLSVVLGFQSLAFAGAKSGTGIVVRSYYSVAATPSLDLADAPEALRNSEGAVPLTPQPEVDAIPTLATDLRKSMVSEELMQQMDAAYATQLKNYSLESGRVELMRDNRVRPFSQAAEESTRREMAKSIRQYMLVRGIPKFLSTREETAGLAQSYTQTVQTVTKATSLQFETQNKWRFSSGVNPFTMRAWASAQNPRWQFEAARQLRTEQSAITASRSLDDSHRALAVYDLNAQTLTPGLQTQFRPGASTLVQTRVPLVETSNSDIVTSVGLNLNF